MATAPDDPKGPMIEIKLTGRLADRLERPAPSAETAQRRHDTETGRRAAQEFATEALYEMVALMRTSTDHSVKFKASKEIMDRAWGKAKPLTEEEKRGEDAASILDILASISAGQSAIENNRTKQIEAERVEEEGNTFDADDFLQAVEDEENPN